MPLKFSKASDVEVIKKILSGDGKAYGELYQRYLDEIYRYVFYRVAKNHLEAEDLTQNVFIKAWEVILDNKTENYHFRALVYRIARNLTIDRWRTQKTEQSFDESNSQLIENSAFEPEQQIISNEANDDLLQAIRALKPDQQDVIICRFINELSHAETAQALGLTESHVRVLQHRALNELRIKNE